MSRDDFILSKSQAARCWLEVVDVNAARITLCWPCNARRLKFQPKWFRKSHHYASLRLFFVRFYCHNYYFLFSHPEEEIDDLAAHLQSSNKAVELWTFEWMPMLSYWSASIVIKYLTEMSQLSPLALAMQDVLITKNVVTSSSFVCAIIE